MSVADEKRVAELIAMAKAEDLGGGDLSSTILAATGEPAEFRLVAKQQGVFAGAEIAAAVLRAYDERIQLDWSAGPVDGRKITDPPVELAVIRGPLAAVLAAERVFLNFLQRLSGVASLTSRFVEAVAGTSAAIMDTRKTTPGWRGLEKYAVRCGGGRNHRMGLYDAVLIKDNHLSGIPTDHLAGAVFEMLNRLDRAERRPTFVEVEADTLDQAVELFKVVGVDVILLDNFSLAEYRRAVEVRDSHGLRGRVRLEASGGVTLDTVRAVAETGVDQISVGAITHSAPAIDLSLERT